MYRVVVFTLLIVMALAAAEDENVHKCSKLNPGLMHCCTSIQISPEMLLLSEIKECYDKRKSVLSCDAEECFAKKLGYYGADGKLNKEEFTSYLEKKFEKEQHLLDSIKENCLNTDISKHGLPNMCDFIKMNICVHTQFAENCSEWSTEGECAGIKELIDICT